MPPKIELTFHHEPLNWLESQSNAMIGLVEKLCNQNSGTFHLEGLEKVMEMLVEEFTSLGGEISRYQTLPMETVGDDGVKQYRTLGQGLHIRKRPNAKRQVLLCIHADTVYGTDSSFQKCQWLPDGRFNGPGVADAKGGLVVMLFALRAFEQSPFADQIGWEVLINPDEEIGSPGSKNIIAEIAERCDIGLLFEPAFKDGTLISWRKGVGNFEFVVRGRSAHSGRDFASGRNAIVAMSSLMTAIADLNTDPDVTLNVGRVSGGGALNVVPDLAIGRVNVRIKDNEQRAEIQGKMERLVADLNERDGISVQMHGEFTSPPKVVTLEVEQLQQHIESCAAALGIEVKWQGSGGASDGNKFADHGLPNIDSLGPCGGDIHSSNEYLFPETLAERAKLAALVLMEYSLNSEH